MIPFLFKKEFIQANLKQPRHELKLPVGINIPTFNIRKLDTFSRYYKVCKERIERAYDKLCLGENFCHYCGTNNSQAMPGFLHDMSGMNLWSYNDVDCSTFMCDECNQNYGKKHLSYNKRVSELYGPAKNAKGFLKFEPEILIPSIENVDKHIIYDIDTYTLIGITERGFNTINYLGLNRSSLVSHRVNFVKDISLNLESDLSSLDYFSLGFYLSFLFQQEYKKSTFFTENPDKRALTVTKMAYKMRYNSEVSRLISNFNFKLINAISPVKKILDSNFSQIKVAGQYKYKSKSIEDIKLFHRKAPGLKSFNFSGIRGFSKNQELIFNGRNNILILGENGVGKSTLLCCLKAALQKNFNITPYLDETYKQYNSEIKIVYINDQQKQYLRNNVVIGDHVTYNSVYINDSRTSKKDVSSLLDCIHSISGNQEAIDWTLKRLNILLDFENIRILNKTVFVSDSSMKKEHSLDQLSSGYTSLICVFYRIINKLNFAKELNLNSLKRALYSTIIFIDEVELHLHPKFKKGIVNRLSNAFPEAIFIMTTHDPLVISSCGKRCDIHMLKKNGTKTEIISDLPDHQNLTTEQILTSPIFNLSTTSSKEKEDKINAYQVALDEEDWVKVNSMRNELTDVGYFGNTYRELLALTAVDAYLKMGINPTIEQIIAEIKSVDDLDA